MKLYRVTGNVPLVAYFVADDLEDALKKADVALWTEDCEGPCQDGTITLETLREPSLREIRAEGWWKRKPLLFPRDEVPTDCEGFYHRLQKRHQREVAARQLTFFFINRNWDG